jgi:hypothetical protein
MARLVCTAVSLSAFVDVSALVPLQAHGCVIAYAEFVSEASDRSGPQRLFIGTIQESSCSFSGQGRYMYDKSDLRRAGDEVCMTA